MTKRATVLSIAAAAAALSAPPAGATVAADTLRPIGLEPFRSCAQLERYTARHALRFPPLMVMPDAAGVVGGAMETAASTPLARTESGGGSFSTTNLQEAGVDEPDIVKTDGERIFAIARGKLHVVDVSGPEPRLAGTLDLGHGWEHQMLVHGDTVLLAWGGYRQGDLQDSTVLARVDASDPSAMRIDETLRIDGSVVTARMTGSTARVVTRSFPDQPDRARPAIEVNGLRRAAVPCTDIRRSRSFAGLGMVTVLTIDVAQGLGPLDTDTVMTDAETVYASPTGLYVATSRWLRPGARALPSSLGTTIHRFDTSDPGRTAYAGSGVVQGHLLDQFSMSEHDGVLRVASSATPQWWDASGNAADSQSFVTTLRPDPETGDLQEEGVVGGLGRGERIYAVRFFGTVGYVVTFRETDPLYTVDLSDPAQPTVLGELKIRGYSAYLHPAGEGRLIGIGQDATDRGETLGTQVSLFDVSDLRDPKRIAAVRLGSGSSSEIEYDHHAFLFWEQTGLAMVPVTSWRSYERMPRSAAVGLRIGDGITRLARIQHPERDYDGVRRSLVAGGRVYTLSDRGLMGSDLDTLAERSWTAF